MTKNETPLEKLSQLSSNRSTRTEKLRAEVLDLLAELELHVEPGDAVAVDGWTLGYEDFDLARYWTFGDGKHWYLLEVSDPETHLSLFSYDTRHFFPADRRVLLLFGRRCGQFVEQLCDQQEAQCQRLDQALDQVAEARESA